MLWIGSKKHHPAAAVVGTHDRILLLPFLWDSYNPYFGVFF